MCRCLIEVFSSSGEVERYVEASDARFLGWKDTWVFGGEQRELDVFVVSHQMKYLNDDLKWNVVRELYQLIRKRNVEADLPVPAEVGCYADGTTLRVLFR